MLLRTTFNLFLCCLLGLVTLQIVPATALSAPSEKRLDFLTIGTQTYSNVTVTTRNKDYIFFLHSQGMMNVKVADLPVETRQLLGYEPPKTVSTWTKDAMVKLEQPEVKQLQNKFRSATTPAQLQRLRSMLSVWVLVAAFGVLVLIHFFTSYCFMLICKKAGHEPGGLVWLPLLQMIPLFRAAGMSGFWILATLVPILNIVIHVLWCVKIAKARGKSVWTAIFLILPFTNLFAFLYLAFADTLERKEDKRIEIMTLETA